MQALIGYKGLIRLARNSGEVSSLVAHEVCENDEFDFEWGLNEKLVHKPAAGERGEITHFYAVAKFQGWVASLRGADESGGGQNPCSQPLGQRELFALEVALRRDGEEDGDPPHLEIPAFGNPACRCH